MPYAKERQGFGFWSWFKPRKQVWYDDDARPVAIEWLLQKGRWDPALQKKTGPTSEAPAEPSKPIPRIPKGVDMILDPEPMFLEDAYGSVEPIYTMGQDEPSGFVRGRQSR